MPSTSVKLAPGVNSDRTPSLNEAGISSSNLIRFREGLVEKRGGWLRYLAATLAGVPRALWPWRDFSNTVFLAAGTSAGLYAISNGNAQDISPRQLTSVLSNALSTGGNFSGGVAGGGTFIKVNDPSYTTANAEVITVLDIVSVGGVTLSGTYNTTNALGNYTIIVPGKSTTTTETNAAHLPTYVTTQGSTTVTVTLQGHGLVAGSQFALTTPITVGGLTLVGAQTVAKVVDTNTFTLQIDQVATSAASSGPTSFQIRYNPTNTYGTASKGAPITAQDWSLSNYGKNLIACAYQGSIYQWAPDGPNVAATIIPNSPQASGILVSDAAQQVIAYGGNPASLFDPNYVAWSDTGNPTQWTAAIGNQAGSYRIPTGSAIIGAATVASTLILLWTDVDVWAMQYVNYPTVYGFTKLASGCGLAAQFAWARMGGLTFWMSQNRFWVFDGQNVTPLDCPVYDDVFPVLSKPNAWKIRGGSNSAFGEVVWFFPSAAGSGENDRYVCYNPAEGTWDTGAMSRSAWADQSVAGLPIGADPQGVVYQHETSPDAAGQPMAWSFTTGLFQVNEGEDFVFIDRIRPDFKFPQGAGTVQVSVAVYKYPGDTPVVKGPYPFTAATEFIVTRCRGRYVALQFSSNDLGSFWRMGRTQLRYQPNGRR